MRFVLPLFLLACGTNPLLGTWSQDEVPADGASIFERFSLELELTEEKQALLILEVQEKGMRARCTTRMTAKGAFAEGADDVTSFSFTSVRALTTGCEEAAFNTAEGDLAKDSPLVVALNASTATRDGETLRYAVNLGFGAQTLQLAKE